MAIATLASGAADAGPLKQATARARQRIAGEQAAYGKATLVPDTRTMRGMGKTRRVFRARIAETGESVFARIPRYGVDGAMRRHNFVRIMADQIGRPGLVPRAATIELAENIGDGSLNIDGLVRKTAKGDKVMVVEDLGKKYSTYGDMGHAAAASAFPEEMRLTGAVLHLLSWQLDGNPANVMVKNTGTPAQEDVRILDHDVALGIKHTGPVINGSAFFPNNPKAPELAFQSRQDRFEELPTELRDLVGGLAAADAGEIAEAYGLEPDEAALVHKTATDIRSHGLRAAVQRFWAESPAYHDTDYHNRKAAEKAGRK